MSSNWVYFISARLSFVRLPGKSPRDSHVTTAIAAKGKGTKPRSVSPAKIRKKRQRSGPSTQADQPKPKKAGRVVPIRRKCASSDEDKSKLNPLNKKCKPVTEEEKIEPASLSLLQKFVCKKPTHQDEVSTSDETYKGKDNSERHGNDSAIDVAGDDEDIKCPAKKDSSDSNVTAKAKNKSKSPPCMEKESTAASMSDTNSTNESSSASLPEDSDEPASPSRSKNVVGTQADATSRKMITPARKTVQDNEGCAEAATPKTCKNKLTPKAAAKLAEKKLREEQRLKEHEEKLKEKAKKVAERLKLKEEKRMEIEKQRLEKEEQKKKKQEEQEIKNREKEEKRKKVAEKFANFFKTGKEEPAQKTVEARDNSGPFQQMQVCRNTALAPTQRTRLSDDARAFLDDLLGATPGDALTTYLDALRSGEHKPMTCAATPPAVIIQDSKDDCVIIEQEPEDDDDEDGSDFASEDMVVCREKNIKDAKNHRGKLLKFCENRRPAYWGTWTKKPAAVGPRKPFAKEEIFDYEYDSDDDWEEEEENGESLSDSEGEKEDGEDEQYEVDNDFFVPHGYLSDDEGQDDKLDGSEDNTAEEDGAHNDAPALIDNKVSAINIVCYFTFLMITLHSPLFVDEEKLKAKQAEFEKELKKQTKQLKPRVLGCLWLHEEEQSSGADIKCSTPFLF
ncbi:hypothetical protein HAZT_HAZT002000 [Hyalella azteca]|uniref:Chromatin assembly factor 1 subunit A dimerization domain-containing protein n=1 Tax=Hyalella azteca TaxID=294128 RepID=A0A6A0GR87_HYAAZ|nr:hypothetical protein HAZT_HAZT002000 [Hyalella azteca]